jgi:multidrug efflux pump subunit AcrB
VLSSNAVQGLALVIIFLLLFLPGKIGFVASLSLPIAVMATIGFMPPLGMNFDAITILALVIALGMLVDNSVVIAENYSRLRQDEGLGATEAAIVSVEQLWLPITCTAFTTIAAFLPMLVTTGIMGQFIKWIPIVVSISLIVSLGESFFFLPMRLKYAGRGTKISDEPQSDWFGKFIIKFENFMDKAIRYRYVASVAFGVVIIGAILLMGFGNKFILFPAEQTEIYLARVEMKKGTTVEETSKVVAELSLDIQEHMGDWVREVVERAGISSMGPTDPKGATGSNQGLLLIYASEFAKFNVPYTEFLEKIRKVEHPQIESLTYKEMVNGPPVGDPINATFRSNNTKSLDAMINHVKDELSEIAGIIDLQVDDIIGEDEVRLNIKYEKLDQLGLTVDDVGNAVRTALSGQVTSKVTLDNKEVDINVRFKDDFRKKLDHLGSVTVMDRMGNLVPIDQVADFAVSSGSVEIKRFDFKRSKTLLGSVELDKITSALANVKLQEVFEKYSKTYKDVSLVFGGEAESTKESMASLGKALFLSLIGIFALLVFLFRSYLRPFIIMTTIPLGLIGFSVAFFLHGRPISFLAMIGVIGLGGIIVNSGIVLLSFIDQLKEEGKLSDHEILVKASGLRLRAVVVSSLTTISGLIPTAYGIGGNDAMLVPMTLAMAWGLTSGTILTLVWVPCAYAILEDWNRFLLKTPLKFLAEKPKKHSQADGLSSQESIKVKTDPLNDKMQESLQ